MKNASITPEFELLVKERLTELADHAPTTVRSVVDTSDLALRPVEQPTPKRRIAGIGALVVALGGGFALTTIAATGGHDGGASTPEAAVEAFVDALEDRDVLGALDLLDPAESDALVDVVRRSADEAVRVGLLSDDADLSDVAGASLGVEGLVLTTELIATDLAVVHLSEGVVDVRFDMAALPFGDELRSRTAEGGVIGEPTDLAEEDLNIATVRRSGRWYVSVGFSIAEAARRGAGVEYPVEAAAAPEGFGSPVAAATAFWERLAGFDIRGAVAMAAPGEGDALARYASLWLPSAERALADARSSGTSVTISGLEFDVQGDGDHRRATPTSFVLAGTLPPPAVFTDYPVFDPEAPVLVHSFGDRGDVGFMLIPAGEPVPQTLDVADFSPTYPSELDTFQGMVNTAELLPDGTVLPFWVETPVATEPATEPTPFRYELADGCVTMTGAAFSDGGFVGGLTYPGSGVEQVADGVWRACTDETSIQSIGALSVMLLRPAFGGAPQLPSIEVVEVDGLWYVSPIRTVFASVLDTFAAVQDGEVFSFDSPIAPMLYGIDRTGLERALVGLEPGRVPLACELIVTLDGSGVVDGIVDDVPTENLQECVEFAYSGSVEYTSEAGSEGPVPVIVDNEPAETIVDE